jgi:uncharacterized protein
MEELKMQQPPWLSVVLTIVVTLGGFMVIGPIIGFVLAIPFIDGPLLDVANNMNNLVDHPELKMPYYIIQGSATFFGLIIIPILHAKFIERIDLSDYFVKHRINLLLLTLTAFIVVFFMGFNSVVIEWNANLSLPESMKGFESWARQSEELAMKITTFLTQFDSTFQFVIGLLVIAVFAGIGEEFVFRGLLQPALHRATKNVHVAIWVSAILFSALHMQFFGLVPRVLLGALFGYLYYWSGNLVVPMFAHFVNNGFQVTALYMVQKGVTDMDPDSTEAAPLSVVISFSIAFIALLYFFKKQVDNQNTSRS